MKGTVIDGFCYSFINGRGKEHLIMSTFALTRSKSKRFMNYQNNQRLEPIKPHKRYAVQVFVHDEAPKGETHE